ncbi:hypothetical protein ANCCAN_07068 [Ancylostoma caninum]|uniref:Uncharacterized protein n=1 Tax=Ancylostoma caninum TaxID=29170 RepID=A0A368GUB1_ANCCA|nr:hypothetical protein ANCCAN_07068 [Ancylostoma caninum]
MKCDQKTNRSANHRNAHSALIESSYCDCGASYSLKHPPLSNAPTPATVPTPPTNVENQVPPPVPPPSADLYTPYNPEVAAIPQMQYPGHQHQQYVTNFPTVTYSSDPTLPPPKHIVDPQRHEFAKEEAIAEVSEYSDYAWKRLDRKKRMQYTVDKNYDYEQELPPADASAPFSASPMGQLNQGLQQPVQPSAPTYNRYNNDEVEVQIQNSYEPKYLGNTVDSEYVGIPNDLYPAYTRQLKAYAAPEKPVIKQLPKYDIHKVVAAPREDVAPQREHVPTQNRAFLEEAPSDIDQCNTAQENPMFRSRFTTQVKLPRDLQAPVRLPEVPRYTTQYSTIGNAFAPVGQPLISEYQFEDLNDLASCIDAL